MPDATVPMCDTHRVETIAAMVGSTPLLEIRYQIDGGQRRIYAKYEIMNMTGSIVPTAERKLQEARADWRLISGDSHDQ